MLVATLCDSDPQFRIFTANATSDIGYTTAMPALATASKRSQRDAVGAITNHSLSSPHNTHSRLSSMGSSADGLRCG